MQWDKTSSRRKFSSVWPCAVEHSPPAATCFPNTVLLSRNTHFFVLYASHRSQVKKASICHQQTSVVIFFFVIQCFSMTFQRIGICSHVLWCIQEGCAQFTHSSSFQSTCSWSLRPTGWFQAWPSLHADAPSTFHLWWEKIKIAPVSCGQGGQWHFTEILENILVNYYTRPPKSCLLNKNVWIDMQKASHYPAPL